MQRVKTSCSFVVMYFGLGPEVNDDFVWYAGPMVTDMALCGGPCYYIHAF